MMATRPAVHAAHARDDAVGREIASRRVGVREQAVLDEVLGAVVAQKRDALATKSFPAAAFA